MGETKRTLKTTRTKKLILATQIEPILATKAQRIVRMVLQKAGQILQEVVRAQSLAIKILMLVRVQEALQEAVTSSH